MTRAEIRLKNHCATCARRKDYGNGCMAFSSEPENCWAWTDDKHWAEKVSMAVKEYAKTHGGRK
jgi:hypothetical protein